MIPEHLKSIVANSGADLVIDGDAGEVPVVYYNTQDGRDEMYRRDWEDGEELEDEALLEFLTSIPDNMLICCIAEGKPGFIIPSHLQ